MIAVVVAGVLAIPTEEVVESAVVAVDWLQSAVTSEKLDRTIEVMNKLMFYLDYEAYLARCACQHWSVA